MHEVASHGRADRVFTALTLAVFLVCLAFAACARPEASSCSVTATSSITANGHVLLGKGDGDVFFYLYPGGQERTLRAAAGPHKFLIFLARIPTPPPDPIRVEGHNLTSGSRMTYEAARHSSEYGTEWGTNFDFPDAGCWQLTVRESGNEGRVIIELR